MGSFNQDGAIALKASVVERPPAEPFSPGFSISAAFVFSIGDLYREVTIDPDLYFDGEEISYAVRAYTHGYDIYHCHHPIVYHYYTRKTDRKHWDDHGNWGQRSITAKARMRTLLMRTGEVADLGPYGLGTMRSIEEYEGHSGVNFRERTVKNPADEGSFPITRDWIRSNWPREASAPPRSTPSPTATPGAGTARCAIIRSPSRRGGTCPSRSSRRS
jgi:hypothetical protein